MCTDSHRKSFLILFWSWHPLRHILGPAAEAEPAVQPCEGHLLRTGRTLWSLQPGVQGGENLVFHPLQMKGGGKATVLTKWSRMSRALLVRVLEFQRHQGKRTKANPCSRTPTADDTGGRTALLEKLIPRAHQGTSCGTLQGGSCDTDIMLLCLLPSLPLSEFASPSRSCTCWQGADAPCTRVGWELQEFACQSTPASAEVSAWQMLPKYTGSEWLS